jgi:hypothetical protein
VTQRVHREPAARWQALIDPRRLAIDGSLEHRGADVAALSRHAVERPRTGTGV